MEIFIKGGDFHKGWRFSQFQMIVPARPVRYKILHCHTLNYNIFNIFCYYNLENLVGQLVKQTRSDQGFGSLLFLKIRNWRRADLDPAMDPKQQPRVSKHFKKKILLFTLYNEFHK